KALIEVCDELWQIGIASCHVGNISQSQLFHQTVLQGLNHSFHSSLGLWGIGTDDLDIQILHGTSKLCQGVSPTRGAEIHSKNAVFIAVKGYWFAMLSEISLCCFTVAENTLILGKMQLLSFPTGIIDKYQQDTTFSSLFEPGTRGTIDLHQFSCTR